MQLRNQDLSHWETKKGSRHLPEQYPTQTDLPPLVAQLCVWDAASVLERLTEIRNWFRELPDSWMINIIELKHQRNHFVCDDAQYQKKIASVFQIHFADGVAVTERTYLRKELIKKTINIL